MLQYIDRETKKKREERVYGAKSLRFLYRGMGRYIRWIFTRFPWFSAWYGRRQAAPKSRSKVIPFIEEFGLDVTEFAEPPENFGSFNEFFIRKLRPEARPIADTPAVLPADARYLFFPNISTSDTFFVKGQKMNLPKLFVGGEGYEGGTLVFARLCPVDYHRFHFPCDAEMGQPRLINGPLSSVNPIALSQNLSILWENKRIVTPLYSEQFGEVQMIEVGATAVGTIVQTAHPGKKYKKGDEKGYFSFGGSTVILVFEPGKIILESDLVTPEGIEIFAKMGSSLGCSQ